MWAHKWLSTLVAGYLDGILARSADLDLLDYSTFYWLGHTDQKLVCARVALASMPRLAEHSKFNSFLVA